MSRYLAIFLIPIFTISSSAQNTETSLNSKSLQYGYSIKARIEIGKPSVLHVSANGGVGSNFLADQIYPTINGELQLYTGGFGTSKPKMGNRLLTLDFVLALTVTTGISKNLFTLNNEADILNRNVPLYYFSNFCLPALINPYDYSISLGTNLVWSSDPGRLFQRLGFINVHTKSIQLSYYNDGGPPIGFFGMGDKKDRYFTGGGILSYHGPVNTAVNLVELGYHKFTGYAKNSYEVATHLQQAYVSYIDQDQKYYNRSVWSLNVANPQQHWGVDVRAYNHVPLDMQHVIHWGSYVPYHLVPYTPSFSIAGETYYSQTNIGLR